MCSNAILVSLRHRFTLFTREEIIDEDGVLQIRLLAVGEVWGGEKNRVSLEAIEPRKIETRFLKGNRSPPMKEFIFRDCVDFSAIDAVSRGEESYLLCPSKKLAPPGFQLFTGCMMQGQVIEILS